MNNYDKLEQQLRERVGRENPFTVPEGYFESLTQRVMSRLPEEKAEETIEVSMKPKERRGFARFASSWWYVAAACLCGAVFSLAFYEVTHEDIDTTLASQSEAPAAIHSYEDAVMDYAMMDNADIYACLME